MSNLQILHISDLHISKEKKFDTSVVLDPLIERVGKDRKIGFKPEIVIATGDIADTGEKAEYDLAKPFFDNLLNKLELSDNRLFIVPGNHDVNRKKYRKYDVPKYENMKVLNDELQNNDFRTDLLKGMQDYFDFIENHYPHLKSKHGRLVPFVCSHNAECGKKIGLVGLNSAWMCRKSPDEKEIAIGEYQVKNAFEELKENGGCDLVINIFHHPLTWLWPEDMKKCRQYFNDAHLLSGHLHEPKGGYIEDFDGSFFNFQAGGAYLSSNSSWPSRFQYITFNWNEKQIELDFRKLKEDNTWCLDAETGDDGKKIFKMLSAQRENKEPVAIEKPSETVTALPPKIPEKYITWLSENYAYMDADKLHGKGQAIPLSLPEIFIPLYADTGKLLRVPKKDNIEVYEELEDIEESIGKKEYLLIEGHPGSGKSTLLKHVTYNLSQGKSVKGLEGFLPILIPLNKLERFLKEQGNLTKDRTAEDVLKYYFETIENVLELETVQNFTRAKKTLLLLDGLDEIDIEHREIVVNAFADYRIKNKGTKVVFTGRPHGIEGAALNRLGKNHIKILPLNMEQVQGFITKWFTYLYPGSSGISGKNSTAMIGEIKEHHAIEKLIDNPLMLTAICILYHDGKELPAQRAELYKKFIDNLLYRRFPDPEKIHDFLKTLAFKMHERDFKGVDRAFAVGILKDVFPRKPEEDEKDYKNRMEKFFDNIEPKCGLLRHEKGQYVFWHLTFQEFLTANYIVDNNTDYGEAIHKYWDMERYKEVIELYIGYLSMENKKWANKVVKDIIEKDDKAHLKKWLLASQAMIDIHKDRRDEGALVKIRDRMIEVIKDNVEPGILVEAGEVLGRLGDKRDLKDFIPVKGGEYKLEKRSAKIKPFEIGKYPVANTWYEKFIKAGGYNNRDYWSEEGKRWLDYKKAGQPKHWDDRRWNCPNSPVVGVCWYEAYAFTRWLTIEENDGFEYRLLDENEWEAAAAGREGREYPWGGKWDKNKCNNGEININKISPVGVFLNGNTPEGISDLSGNVWEWTSSDYYSKKLLNDFNFDEEIDKLIEKKEWSVYLSKLDEKKRELPVLRGGSWVNNNEGARCDARYWVTPDSWDYAVGFRCSRTKVTL